MISQHPFLTTDETDAIVRTLSKHPELEVDRKPETPHTFGTYGRAAYLDVLRDEVDPEREYYAKLADANKGLREQFGWVYERLGVFMTRLLDGEVRYDETALALPGFHVFRGPAIALADQAGAHFDMQYRSLRLPVSPDTEANPVTFTVPVRMPCTGTGLIVYNIDPDGYTRAARRGRVRNIDEYARRKVAAYHAYEHGRLVLHHGLFLHRLSSPGPIAEDDERITFQGHGIRCDGTWILYW